MRAKLAVAGLLILAVCSSASAATSSKQRVEITVKESGNTFVLTPLSPGALKPDSGIKADCCWTERHVMRNGEQIEIDNPLLTFFGKRGTLVVRYEIAWVDAGNGFTVGTGPWHVVRGTGAYAHVTGSGRSAHAWPPSGFVGQRSEGFLVTR
jgi:hypothetical protein